MNNRVELFINKETKWQNEIAELRSIILSCKLDEDIKWGKPCYSFNGSNVVIIQGFKEYCAVLFFKGALLKDPGKILVKPGENTQAGRQIRFNSVSEIIKLKPVIKKYLLEAVEAEKAGLKVELRKSKELIVPDELLASFAELPSFKNAFYSLTPGRQRAYILFFSSAKQTQTRTGRIEKYMPKILKGKGMND